MCCEVGGIARWMHVVLDLVIVLDLGGPSPLGLA